MDPVLANLKASVDSLSQRDPALHEEVIKKRDEAILHGTTPDLRPTGMRSISLLVGSDLTKKLDSLPYLKKVAIDPETKSLLPMEEVSKALLRTESVIAAEASSRPVLLIQDNGVVPQFIGPSSELWRKRVTEAKSLLDAAIPAVGRIELMGHPEGYPWVGTGWLVEDDLIVTNQHVARKFSSQRNETFVFQLGRNDNPIGCRVDFLEESQRSNSAEYAIQEVVWIAAPDQPDVAFLRLARPSSGNLPRPIPLAREQVLVDTFVAAVGYPARDPDIPDQGLVQQIFGEVYEKKRLAPGQITHVQADELQHDCSTLGGNSGSVLIDLATGEAVGLHFAGLYQQANYAVPAITIRRLLEEAKQQIGRRPSPAANTGAPGQYRGEQPTTILTAAGGGNEVTFKLQIPLEVSIRLGSFQLPSPQALALDTSGGSNATNVTMKPGAGNGNIDQACQEARRLLAGIPEVIAIHPGFRFKNGWITDERVVVIELNQKLTSAELSDQGILPIPAQILGIGVDVRTAAALRQLAHLGLVSKEEEAAPKPAGYREPTNLKLVRIKEKMRAIFHVSPESGFPVLEAFLGRVREHLTATMYEWDEGPRNAAAEQFNHIAKAVCDAMMPVGRTLRMVTQRLTMKSGTQGTIAALKNRLGERIQHVWAPVTGSNKLFTGAYHIKVAARDGEEVWLSSGNWKDSNQPQELPPIDEAKAPKYFGGHNREWHVVLENKDLATIFQQFIEFDFQEATRVAAAESVEESIVAEEKYVLVPIKPEGPPPGPPRPTKARYFKPLVLDRELDIEPLLTPDRDSRGRRLFALAFVEMLKRANRKILLQNQSFSFLADNTPEFKLIFDTLLNKQQQGVEIRIITRDGGEFDEKSKVSQQEVLERIKQTGFDTSCIRLMQRCHSKALIIDAKEVLMGSHNLTNRGTLFNRDASLLVRDPEVATYFEEIFNYDWEYLAFQRLSEPLGAFRPDLGNAMVPAGYRKVLVTDLLASLND
ncbi:phospholipase D-like domain-containing protein [Hymenobacter sp. BT559]|uniref:phospholipase D-like domain-containing protein n=1 Tax=Hymenobacter sp. BT559 TaxID=2795729 RepID=UPI0018EBFA7C|nr:phospholipase D-like domain-containing protein [Hymenobacter sp. BT559]MBJ6146283.1 trypsin-like peptidase domain-containing protein [Hymenobacter sp. BT559]